MYEHVEDIPVALRTAANDLNDHVERLHGRLVIENTGYVRVNMPATKDQFKKNIPSDSLLLTGSIDENIQKAIEFVRIWEQKWSLKNSVTKVMVKEYVKHKLSTNDKWALNALLKIYSFQTANEKALDHTVIRNNVGFSGHDAEFLSSIAKQLITRIEDRKTRGYDPDPVKCLSQKQRDIVRKIIQKYWQQIVENSDEIKLLYQTKHFHESNENRVQTRLPL